MRVWILCLYFMGLNLSNEQIAAELDVDADTAQVMATQLREGVAVLVKGSRFMHMERVVQGLVQDNEEGAKHAA